MDTAEFDKFADEYRSNHAKNIKITGETPEYFAEYKVADAAKIAKANGLADKIRILDFGSGVGGSIPFFMKHFSCSDLVCADVSEKSLQISKERFQDAVDYKLIDGLHLPFSDNSFDLVFSACVFHHIDQHHHLQILKELNRVLNKGGCLIIFEHNPLNPLTVRAVNSCPFDENAVLISARSFRKRLQLSGFLNVTSKYRVFFPRMLSYFRFFESKMGWFPIGAQYYVFGRKNEMS